MRFVVALTGGIGSGKSTVAHFFALHSVSIIDADVIARDVVAIGSEPLKQIALRYGDTILLEDGSLNRSKLREIVFTNKDNNHQGTSYEKEWLNGLLHPIIRDETQKQIALASSDYVLWVVPLLIENQLQNEANRVLVIDVSEQTQIERTIKRDNVSIVQVRNIIAAQIDRAIRLSYADDIIAGESSFKKIETQVAQLHHLYLCLAKKAKRAL